MKRLGYRITKRALDLIFASGVLVVTAPLWLAIAAAIRLESGSPVLFRQTRVGRGRKPFRILKFRTMKVGADGESKLTKANDDRLTGMGRLLRGTRLDELPQLLNVIRGDMSVVGPRPDYPEYVERYSAEQLEILEVRPGMAGNSFNSFHDEGALLARAEDPEAYYVEHLLPAKAELELEYVRSRSLATDLKILARAFGAVLTPNGGGGSGHGTSAHAPHGDGSRR